MDWIDVNERLPEQTEPGFMDAYLVWLPIAGEYEFAYYNFDGQYWEDNNGCNVYPSHWMPMPEPPKM